MMSALDPMPPSESTTPARESACFPTIGAVGEAAGGVEYPLPCPEVGSAQTAIRSIGSRCCS